MQNRKMKYIKSGIVLVCLFFIGCGVREEDKSNLSVKTEESVIMNESKVMHEEVNVEKNVVTKTEETSVAYDFEKTYEAVDNESTALQGYIEETVITEFDKILCETEEYVIVAQKDSGFDTVSVKIGVLNSRKTEWIHPLSNEHIFVQPDGAGITAVGIYDKNSYLHGEIRSSKIQYIGNGMFVATAGISSNNQRASLAFYNVIENSGFMLNGAPISYNYFGNTAVGSNYNICFEDGKAIFVGNYKEIFTIDIHGNAVSTGLKLDSYKPILGKYSGGLFFCNNGFYDSTGNKIIDLSQYEKQIYEYYSSTVNGPYFGDGERTVKVYMNGADGEKYYIEVDCSGNFITNEPVKA